MKEYFPHHCCDGHEMIGFRNGPAEEAESCPVCLLRQTIADQDVVIKVEHDAFRAEIARLKEWNQTRAGEFAVTEQRLATELARLRLLAEDMADDMEAVQRGATWSLLCAAPSEPGLVMYRKFYPNNEHR